MEGLACDVERWETLELVARALSSRRVGDRLVRVGCLVTHPDAYTRAEIRKRLELSAYRFDQTYEDLRWTFDLPPMGALGKHILLFTLGQATNGRSGQGVSDAVSAGALIAETFVEGLALPTRERKVLACILSPSIGTYKATGCSVGRSRTVVRRATRHLRLHFSAPRKGQLVLKVLHAVLASVDAGAGDRAPPRRRPCAPKGGPEREARGRGPSGRPNVGCGRSRPFP